MVTIARFRVPEEAHLFRTFLESRGIVAHVFDEHMVQIAWYYSDAIGGVRVVVDQEDVEEAADRYRDYREAIQAEPRMETVARAWPVVLLFSALLGVPALLFGRKVVRRREA